LPSPSVESLFEKVDAPRPPLGSMSFQKVASPSLPTGPMSFGKIESPSLPVGSMSFEKAESGQSPLGFEKFESRRFITGSMTNQKVELSPGNVSSEDEARSVKRRVTFGAACDQFGSLIPLSFAPVCVKPDSTKCNVCDRPTPNLVLCMTCGYQVSETRSRRDCEKHPKRVDPKDVAFCPTCKKNRRQPDNCFQEFTF